MNSALKTEKNLVRQAQAPFEAKENALPGIQAPEKAYYMGFCASFIAAERPSCSFVRINPHFLDQVMQALVMLGLRDGSPLQKRVEGLLLSEEQDLVLFLLAERGPLFVFYA